MSDTKFDEAKSASIKSIMRSEHLCDGNNCRAYKSCLDCWQYKKLQDSKKVSEK